MRSMGRTSASGRLWSKARTVVSALGAFKRSYSKVDLQGNDGSARAMAEMPSGKQKASSKKGCIALSACALLVVVVVVSTVVGVTVSKRQHDNNGGEEDVNANSAAAICSKTLYPEVCNSTLFGSDTSNPKNYVSTAMKAAMVAVSKSLEAVRGLKLTSGPNRTKTLQYSTLEMCEDVFTDCLEQLNTSLSRVSSLKQLQSLKSEVGDIQQYMAAALTYQDTCLTGVQDFGLWNASDAINGTHGTFTTMVLSNALSLVNSLARVADFQGELFPRHSRRLAASSDHQDYFPRWLSREGRRLLQVSNKPAPNAVVALDGSGTFKSIQKAVDAAPSSGVRWVIYVKKGTYSEYVSVPKGKKNLMMYGDGPGNTIITGKKSVVGTGTTTFLSATFAVVAPGFIAKDMTIQNTAGPAGEQAVALRAGGDQQAFSNLNLEGYQDTLYAHALRQFYSGCTIIGTIDYIFGNAAAVFQNCNLRARLGRSGSQNIYTASGRTDPGQNTGLSFLSCTVGAAPGLPDSFPTYLGRPWKPYAQTLFIKSTLASCVNPVGWLLWNGDANSGKSVNYGEYGNTGPGANTARRVKWSKQISVAEATKFTVSNFIAGQEWLPATSIAFNSAL